MRSILRILSWLVGGVMAWLTLYVVRELSAIWQRLNQIDAHTSIHTDHNTHAGSGLTYEAFTEITPTDESISQPHIKRHVIEDGIERVTVTPATQRYQTPIVFLHGMWHGAWCWQWWQTIFADLGWQSHAISLPGHGQSPLQRPIRDCTLDYYTSFVRAEIERFDTPPIIMGHSMGGAITQWYLKYVRNDLPAAVLVASWVADVAMRDGWSMFLKLDPLGMVMTAQAGDATPYMRNPQRAAAALISKNAIITPEELHAQLGPESSLVLFQHNPPFWSPAAADDIAAPMLYIAGERDAVISLPASRRAAEHYKADFMVAADAGHNIMMDTDYAYSANRVHEWLLQQGIT